MKQPIKLLLMASICLLLILGGIENNIFIKRELIHYHITPELNSQNFRGYPNYLLFQYSGMISSKFKYSALNEALDSVLIETVMRPHQSWIKPRYRNSPELLHHEQYHFNINEVVARGFRKTSLDMPDHLRSNKMMSDLYTNYYLLSEKLNSFYDVSTDHGLLIERQKDWEYIIDSLLNEYLLFSSPKLIFSNVTSHLDNYFRKITIDHQNRIVGKFPLDSIRAPYMNHYRFYYKNGEVTRIEYREKNELIKDDLFGTPVIKLERNETSEIWRFANMDNTPMANKNKIHAILIDRNEDQITRTHLDFNDQPCNDDAGISRIEWILDEEKRRATGMFYNINNLPGSTKEGYSIVKYKYDRNNYISEMSYYDINNEPYETDKGISIVKYENDLWGNPRRIYTFNSHNHLHPHEGDIAGMDYNYDKDGNIIRTSYYLSDGTPYVNENNIAISYFDYDCHANLINERHYGLNRNLIFDENGLGRIVREFDNKSNVITVKNMDAYDRYINDNSGICKWVFTYDSNNNILTEMQYATNDFHQPVFLKKLHLENDLNGNLLSIKLTDKADNFLPDESGVCLITQKTNNSGNIIYIAHFDSLNQLCLSESGAAIIKKKYDKKNNLIETAYFDTFNQPVLSNSGVATERYLYNESNQIIERRFYDEAGQLTLNESGYMVVQWERDQNGNFIRESYLDENYRLATNHYGIASIIKDYDNRNNLIQIAYLDSLEQPHVITGNGVSTIKYQHNEKNQMERVLYLDSNGIVRHGDDGYAIEKHSYDKRGNLSRVDFLCELGFPVQTTYGYASLEFRIDLNGNKVAQILKDENNQLIADSDGDAIYNWIHDRNGHVVSFQSFAACKSSLDKIDHGPFNENFNFLYFIPQYHTSYNSYTENRQQKTLTTYHPNGQKETEVIYVDGRPEGHFYSWYDTGEIESTIEYRDGLRNGETIEYYKNGKIRRIIFYQDGDVIANLD